MRPEGPKIEAEGRERGWGWGRGLLASTHPLGGLGAL